MGGTGNDFNVAILGCGNVGGGTARILLDQAEILAARAGRRLRLARIATRSPEKSAARFGLPRGLFAGSAATLGPAEFDAEVERILRDPEIHAVVETLGGHGEKERDLCVLVLESGKHLATANKALLALRGDAVFGAARATGRALGIEASVCAAIPAIRAVCDGFSGDVVEAFSGILNGTSNYILDRMAAEGLGFEEALRQATEAGYAEADPSFDVDGIDAGHKLAILVRLAFGLSVDFAALTVRGIRGVSREDLLAAAELGCRVKLIGRARKDGGRVRAEVAPMMVRAENPLAEVRGTSNALRFCNRYAGEQFLQGKGAGSLETGSSVVADLVFIARHACIDSHTCEDRPSGGAAAPSVIAGMGEVDVPYVLIFDAEDVPGITGLVASAIGDEGINIDTVGHNLHGKAGAVFCVETMPCRRDAVDRAVARMKAARPGVFRAEPKVYPVLA